MGFFKTIWNGIKGFASGALGSTLIPSVAKFGFDAIAAKRERKFANEAWEAQNRYNSPVQQLARYRAAGMNPAYGAGMASGNAQPPPAAVSSVAHFDMPNVLQNLGMYQSLKNAAIEGDRLNELVKREKLNNAFLESSLDWRLGTTQAKMVEGTNKADLMKYNKDAAKFKVGWMKDLSGNPMQAKYNLDLQRFNQQRQMFDIDLAIAKIMGNRYNAGIDDPNSAFLNVLLQNWNGSDSASKILPYVIGQGAVNWLGGAATKMLPNMFFGKFTKQLRYAK